MDKKLIAKSSVLVNAPLSKVWDALINPEMIKKYMFGTKVVSDWKEGSSIVWKGEWQGKEYEDKGRIVKLIPEKVIEYTHLSSSSEDKPENYHLVTVSLIDDGKNTKVSLLQDNNKSVEEKDESEKNWHMMLIGLKKTLEN